MAFFHCDTSKYARRRKLFMWLVLFPLFLGLLATSFVVIANLRAFHDSGMLGTVFHAAIAVSAAGTLLFYLTWLSTETAIKRHARYTFFEICPKALVYSRYSGRSLQGGKIIITRKLYIIPLAALASIGYSEKNGKVYLEAAEKIKSYHDRSERLDYKIIDNTPTFDGESWWYNENGHETLDFLTIPPIFGNSDEFCQKIALAKRNFDNLPKPRPYVHKEADFVKRRKALAKMRASAK
ncbi:MAG: hypothetical protein FWH20_01055 [Oscillospiraceae bacterium]|nr:hypothetical protein [Oscillospiraceae bacterium]